MSEKKTPDYAEQIKQLRAQRGTEQKELAERAKEQARAQKLALTAIETEAKTVPEIAEETGMPTQEVFWWVTALRKYGKIQDKGKRGEYIAYQKKYGFCSFCSFSVSLASGSKSQLRCTPLGRSMTR